MAIPVQYLRRLSLVSILSLASVLTGCGVGVVTESSTGPLLVSGRVHGGLQPVTGATIQLFTVGTSGNGSAARNILTRPVATDSNSYFSITGDYTCASPNEQVYLVARGGNPGFAGNVNNPALVLLSALGSCTNLINNPGQFIMINEVSTVAAAYALASFTTAYDHVGGSATNVTGMTNAFLDAQLLANTSTGQMASLPANLSIQQKKLYALADAIAPCVNSTGGSACAPLFAAATPSGGTAPTDVLGALLNIIKNPGNNVSGVFNLIGPTPPYMPALSSAPKDWTMTLTVAGGGLYEPTALALDATGNVWVTNFGGPNPAGGYFPTGVVAFSPQGTPLSETPYGVGQQTEAYGLTVDKHGDVWVTSEENTSHGGTYGSLVKFGGASSSTPGALEATISDVSLDFPEAVASDPVAPAGYPSTDGRILVANYASGTASIYDLNGTYLNNVAAFHSEFPVGITSDGAGGLWLANQGYYTITHVSANGTVNEVRCCSAADTVALDPQGNVWVTNSDQSIANQYTISEVSSSGVMLLNQVSGGGLSSPDGGAVDAAGQFWVANYYDNSLSEIAGNSAAVPAGTGLTPFALGKDAAMTEPFAVAPDASGNLWISNRAKNNLVMFFGLATPTKTPVTPLPSAP